MFFSSPADFVGFGESAFYFVHDVGHVVAAQHSGRLTYGFGSRVALEEVPLKQGPMIPRNSRHIHFTLKRSI